VAEDDKMVRGLIDKTLERYGYSVLMAASGKEAVELARSYRDDIHLLLTDVVMPGMPGKDVSEAVEALRPGIRIIYMSGYTDETITRHGILPNGTNFLQKPISPAGLVKKVREVLDG